MASTTHSLNDRHTGDEFDLISRYFKAHADSHPQLIQGIGDDGAVLAATPYPTVISIDTSIAGTHFPTNAPAKQIAARAVHVAASDLAAMGASARWFTVSLSIPAINPTWLESFAEGLFQAAKTNDMQLIGGDTTAHSTLMITVQVHGELSTHRALYRHGAVSGDGIYVTGPLGDAAAGCALYQQQQSTQTINNHQQRLITHYLCPQALLTHGTALAALPANSCIDISDGLIADLSHILKASGCGAALDAQAIPLSEALLACYSHHQALQFALTGGDDYHLCFTVSPSLEPALAKHAILGSCYRIGTVTADKNTLKLLNVPNEYTLDLSTSYNHFSP